MERQHPNLDSSVLDEMNKPTLLMGELELGQRIRLNLGEDDDCRIQASLLLELCTHPDTDDRPARMHVLEADLDDEIVSKNERAGIPEPRLMGGDIYILFSAVYRRGHMPPITLAQNDAITKGKHVYLAMPTPSPENPDRNIRYHAEVLDFELV